MHPGEVLLHAFIIPPGISQHRLAKAIGVDARRIRSIVLGATSLNTETTSLVSRCFGTSAKFLMGL